MKCLLLCLLFSVVLASNSQKLYYYGEPTVTTQTGFIKVDPQTNAWQPAADGFATSALVGYQVVRGIITDSKGSSFLFGQFSLWNGTYVGALINMNTTTMEPSIFNSGILGEFINGMTYFDNEQQVALIGRFWGFQQNPSQPIEYVGACSVLGTPCYPLGQGLEDYLQDGTILSIGQNLFALYTDRTGQRVVYLNITDGTSGNWEIIYKVTKSDQQLLSMEIFQGSLWIIGGVLTPDDQIVAAASWNIDENSWEYMYNSNRSQYEYYGTPVTSVSPDGQNLYAVYSNSTSRILKWDNVVGNWTSFYTLNCFYSQVIAASNEGLLTGCNNSVYYITSDSVQILPDLNCSTTWVSMQVSLDNTRLFSICQLDTADMQSVSYDLTTANQVKTILSDFEMLQLSFDSMCVYGSKIFISGPFTKVKDRTAWGMAIWDNDSKQWYAILDAIMGIQCHCDTDGDELVAACLAVGGQVMYPLLIIDWADSDLGTGPFAKNIQLHNLTELVAMDTFAFMDDVKLVDGEVYIAVVAIGVVNSTLAKWTEEAGAEIVVSFNTWDVRFAISDDTVYFAGQFYTPEDFQTAARYDMTSNTWLPMDQLKENQYGQGKTNVVVLWNSNSTAQVYVGGQFNTAGDTKVSNWLGYNTDGEAADAVAGGVTGIVKFLQPLGDRMYILSAPDTCSSVYQPSCGTVVYFDGVQKTYSYPIASGVGIIAVGYDVENTESSSSTDASDTLLVAIVISALAFVVLAAGIGGIVLLRKWSNKRSHYQEIPDVKEAVRSSQIDFQSEEFVMKSVLGRGAYGTVWSCVFPHRAGGTYAVKQMLLSKGDTKKIEIVKKEIDLLEKFRHPHIVHYCGHRVESTETSVEFFIFMELYEQPCSLKGVIQKALKQSHKRKNHFTYSEIKNYLFQIADGLNYLHQQGVAHRDLKCANILIRVKGAVVNSLHIADFGISKAMSEGENVLSSTVLGTPSFMAPEVLKNQLYDAFKADIWSFGMLMYEMLSWKEPEIPGKRPEIPEESQLFMEHDHRFHNVLEIFEKCSQEDPNLRPTAAELLYLCENLP